MYKSFRFKEEIAAKPNVDQTRMAFFSGVAFTTFSHIRRLKMTTSILTTVSIKPRLDQRHQSQLFDLRL